MRSYTYNVSTSRVKGSCSCTAENFEGALLHALEVGMQEEQVAFATPADREAAAAFITQCLKYPQKEHKETRVGILEKGVARKYTLHPPTVTKATKSLTMHCPNKVKFVAVHVDR